MAKLVISFLTIVGLVFIFTSCPKNERVALSIINNSDEDILWLFRLKEFGEWYEISSINSYLGNIEKNKIPRGDTYIDKFNSDAIKSHLEKGWYKYYIFNYDSIKTIPWKRICDERIILKEVTFNSWDDFERCNFEITYP